MRKQAAPQVVFDVRSHTAAKVRHAEGRAQTDDVKNKQNGCRMH